MKHPRISLAERIRERFYSIRKAKVPAWGMALPEVAEFWRDVAKAATREMRREKTR